LGSNYKGDDGMNEEARPQMRIEVEACTGCMACVIACALLKEKRIEPSKARIRVFKNFPDLYPPVFQPTLCRMCPNAPCIEVCPTGALSQNGPDKMVHFDEASCNGCGLCVEECPFEAIWIDTKSNTLIKCDWCDGDPICVKHCTQNAIIYVSNGEGAN